MMSTSEQIFISVYLYTEWHNPWYDVKTKRKIVILQEGKNKKIVKAAKRGKY